MRLIKLIAMPVFLLSAFLLIRCIDSSEHAMLTASDKYIRDRVVMIQGNEYSCTGVEIMAPSGENYILTAAHCRNILDENETATAITEDGEKHVTHLVKLKFDDDLMLMTPVDGKSIPVAEDLEIHEHIHTLTHGERKPTYRTDGEVLDIEPMLMTQVSLMDEPILYMECQTSPKRVQSEFDLLGICSVEIISQITTAKVVPGSSGGPVLNEKGELVGIVSNTDGFFSGVVALEEIQAFLDGR